MEYFHFNQYSSLLLLGWFQGVVFVLLLLVRSQRWDRPADRFGAGLIFVCTLYISQWMLGFAGWYDAHNWQTTVMFYIPWSNFLLIGPLVYFTFIAITNSQFAWKRAYRWHFAPWTVLLLKPFAVFMHDIVIQHWLNDNPLAYFHGTRGSWEEYLNSVSVPFFQGINIASRLHLIAYLALTIIRYNQYRKYVKEHFSNEGMYAFRWLKVLLIVFVLGIGLALAGNMVSYFVEMDYVDSWWGNFAMATTIYIVSIQLYAATPDKMRALHFEPEPVAATLGIGEKEETIEKQTPQIDGELKALAEALLLVMEEDKPYLDPDLNLASLSSKLKTNSSLLSKSINATQALNFNDFVNAYRCREVINKLNAGKHEQLTFLSIAIDAGFNSKATFNRAFKKYTGESPRQYVSNHDMSRLTS